VIEAFQRRRGEAHPSRAHCYCRPRLEPLEERELPSWTITDLRVLAACTATDTTKCTSIARAVNPSGDAAGSSSSDSTGTQQRAVLFSGGSITNLGTFPNATGDSNGFGINIHDDVAGESIDSDGYVHAFREKYQQAIEDVGVISGSGASRGTSINDNADVGGYSVTRDLPLLAFWYSGTTMHPLPGITNQPGFANAIDNSSTPNLVGASKGFYDGSCSINYNHAYTWTGSTPISQKEVGSLDGEEAHAFGLNSAGVVVGDSSVGHPCVAMPTPHAFFAIPNSIVPPFYTLTQIDAGVTWISDSRARRQRHQHHVVQGCW
jgi:hypothetical protein